VTVVAIIAVAVMVTTAAVSSGMTRARVMAFAVAMALLVERPVAVVRV
jgi:hypothetical protein